MTLNGHVGRRLNYPRELASSQQLERWTGVGKSLSIGSMLPKMVKVALHDDDGDVEILWATPRGNEHYRLENSPFFVYGISFLDEVKAPLAEGLPTFEKVVAKSGHRTVRILMPDTTAPEAKPHLEGLIELGCSYEGVQPKLLSVDVPPGVSL